MRNHPLFLRAFAVALLVLFGAPLAAMGERFGPAAGSGAMVGSLTGHLTGGVTLQLDSTGNSYEGNGNAAYRALIFRPTQTDITTVEATMISNTDVAVGVRDGGGISLGAFSRTGAEVTGSVVVGTGGNSFFYAYAPLSTMQSANTGTISVGTGWTTTDSGSLYLTTGNAGGISGSIEITTGGDYYYGVNHPVDQGGSIAITAAGPSGATGGSDGSIQIRTGAGYGVSTGTIVLSTEGTNSTAAANLGQIYVSTGDVTGAGDTASPIIFAPGAGPTGSDDAALTVNVKDRGSFSVVSTQSFTGGGLNAAPVWFNTDVSAANGAGVIITQAYGADVNGTTGLMIYPTSVVALGANKARSNALALITGHVNDNAASLSYGWGCTDGITAATYGACLFSTSTAPYFIRSLGSGKNFVRIAGAAATVSTCGGGTPSISGSNTNGTVTVGTGSPTACTLTFSAARDTVPDCICTPFANATCYVTANSASAVTFTFSATPTKFSYVCMEH